MNKKLENKKHGVVNTTIAGNASETIQNYGSAISHHTAAYKGNMTVDGVHVGKGLKDIANSKVHPDYEQTNIKQQAGFAAENKEVARRNADLAMEGKKPNVSRTAQALKAMIDTPILTKDGNLTLESETVAQKVQNKFSV